jgi:hypothetical protein
MTKKIGTFTIDMTPSWEGLLPLFLDTLQDPKRADLHEQTLVELRRMAKLADAYAAEHKDDPR